jgi:hypothetical protein
MKDTWFIKERGRKWIASSLCILSQDGAEALLIPVAVLVCGKLNLWFLVIGCVFYVFRPLVIVSFQNSGSSRKPRLLLLRISQAALWCDLTAS